MPHRHINAARHVIKRLDAKLHVIAVVFNPLRFQSRYNLFRDFEKHATANPEVDLKVVELAFGNRPFEVTQPDNPRHWQIRTDQELWHKERMINVAVAKMLPTDWQYVAWVDADVTFINPDWAHETMQQLQHYHVVQMFTHAMDVDASGAPLEFFESFAGSHVNGAREFPALAGVKKEATSYGSYYGKGRYWHPGYGWAYRREAWNTLGGLLDVNIVGGGDHQMAYGLIGRIGETVPAGTTSQYGKIIRNWGQNASLLKRNIGAVSGTIVHHYHGPKVNRGYYNRWRILTENKFDPIADLKTDWQQMWALAGNKIALRDQLRAYFRARNEDAI